MTRDHNEDRLLARPPLYVVADGLGGQAAGEVAAQMLIDILGELPAQPTGQDLTRAIEAADQAIHEASTQEPGRRGMSTTCVALLLLDGAAQVSHVGDSRAYRLRAGVLTRLTDDHSVVGELVRGGVIDEAAAETDDRRHILTQALGSGQGVTVTSTSLDVVAGDRFLLCSDGLSGQVNDAGIESVLLAQGDPNLAADELVRLANAAGGIDNVTVIIVDAQVSGSAAPAASVSDPMAPGASLAAGPPARRSPLVAGIAIAGILAVVGLIAVMLVSGGSPAPTIAPSAVPSASPATSEPPIGPTAVPSEQPPTSGPSETGLPSPRGSEDPKVGSVGDRPTTRLASAPV